MEAYRRLEDLAVYQRLCPLHIEIGEHTHRWPTGEKYELGSQAIRSSNSAPALAGSLSPEQLPFFLAQAVSLDLGKLLLPRQGVFFKKLLIHLTGLLLIAGQFKHAGKVQCSSAPAFGLDAVFLFFKPFRGLLELAFAFTGITQSLISG